MQVEKTIIAQLDFGDDIVARLVRYNFGIAPVCIEFVPATVAALRPLCDETTARRMSRALRRQVVAKAGEKYFERVASNGRTDYFTKFYNEAEGMAAWMSLTAKANT